MTFAIELWAKASVALFVIFVGLVVMLFIGKIDVIDPDIGIGIILFSGVGSLLAGIRYLYLRYQTKCSDVGKKMHPHQIKIKPAPQNDLSDE